MDAACSFETLICSLPTQCKSSENHNLNSQRRGNIRHKISVYLSSMRFPVSLLIPKPISVHDRNTHRSVAWWFLVPTVANDTANFHNGKDSPCLLRTTVNTTQGKPRKCSLRESSYTPASFNEEILFTPLLVSFLSKYVTTLQRKIWLSFVSHCSIKISQYQHL
jgi:hypothetical protein